MAVVFKMNSLSFVFLTEINFKLHVWDAQYLQHEEATTLTYTFGEGVDLFPEISCGA